MDMEMSEKEMGEQNVICNREREVTPKEIEKLEHELQRAKSEIRDLKELIIKLLFDRYRY